MHNRALLNLRKKYPNASACIDQFAEPKLYFSYLKGEEEVLKDLDFSVKGESVFPVVALASVIARYRFLTKMEEMGKEYGLTFPLGSGKDVDEFAVKFAKKYGLDIIQVLDGGDISKEAYEEDGPHINSDFLNGLNKED